MKPKGKKLYFAVITSLKNYSAKGDRSILRSGRSEGDWASFIGQDASAVVRKAIAARDKWEKNGYGPYSILTGEITGRVQVPTTYRVVRFKGE
jgi:hypothetical protein